MHIEGVGVTQSHTLWDAEDMARDLIARREDLPGDGFAVRITPEIGGGLDEETRAAREAVNAADQAQRLAAAHHGPPHGGCDKPACRGVTSPRCSTCHRSASHSSCGLAPEDLTIRRPGQQKPGSWEEIGTAMMIA